MASQWYPGAIVVVSLCDRRQHSKPATFLRWIRPRRKKEMGGSASQLSIVACQNARLCAGQSARPFGDAVHRKKEKLVRLEGEGSNSLFEALEEWERHLTQVDFDSLRCSDEQLRQ